MRCNFFFLLEANELDLTARRFTSSSWILSICLARDVACLDFDALAENRLTNDLSSLICAFF